MRNERRWVANAEHSAIPSLEAGSTTDGAASARDDGPAGMARPEASIDAQILQHLRTRLRTSGSLESVAGEVRRLGTLAAALHRGATPGLPAGIPLAMDPSTAADGRGGTHSEDAA